jgi:hemoglobin/transferrin/lactoferrin receptor protein
VLKTRFGTNHNQLMEHAEVAAKISEAFDVLAAGTWNKQPNYLDGNGNVVNLSADELISGLAKVRYRPKEGEELTLSALRFQDNYDVGQFSRTVKATTAKTGTYSANYRWEAPDNDLIDLRSNAYYTTTRTDQVIAEDRDDKFPEHDSRVGEKRWYEIATFGGDARNTSTFDTGSMQHNVTYGADFYRDAADSAGFDSETTPPGTRWVYGAFAQDRIVFGKFEVIPALRYDGYDLTAGKIDNGGERFSPKITAAVSPWDPVTFFTSYAEGLRAPTLTESLINATHPGAANFKFLPNPRLKAEVAHEIQAGVNLRFDNVATEGDQFRAKLVGYRNIVDHYIELTPVVLKTGEVAQQYQNIAAGELWGAEVEGTYDMDTVFVGLSGTYVRGINAKTGERLSSIPASRIIGTVGGRLMDGQMEMGMRISRVAGVEDPGPNSIYPPTEPYTTVDLFASAKINDRLSLALNVDNLLDVNYKQYLNVLESPGRNAKFTATLRF